MFVRFIHFVMCSFGSCIFIAWLYAIVYLCHNWFTEVLVDRIILLQNVYYYDIHLWTFCLYLLGHMYLGKNLPGHRLYAFSISLNVVNFFPNGCADLHSKQQWMSFLSSTSFPTLASLRLLILANWRFWKTIVLFEFSFPWLLARLNAFAYIHCSLFPHL